MGFREHVLNAALCLASYPPDFSLSLSHTHAHTHTHTYIEPNTLSHTYTHTYNPIHTHMHLITHTHTITHSHTHSHTHTNTHTQTHTHTHTHTQTHTHPPFRDLSNLPSLNPFHRSLEVRIIQKRTSPQVHRIKSKSSSSAVSTIILYS